MSPNRFGVLTGIMLVLLLIGWIGFTYYTSTFAPPPAPTPGQGLEILGERRMTDEPWDFFSWSPDGNQLLLTRMEYADPTGISEPSAAPQEPSIESTHLAILQIASGEIITIPQPGTWAVWSPDGSSILISDRSDPQYEIRYYIYSLDEGFSLPIEFPHASGYLFWLEEGMVYQAEDGLWLMPIIYRDLEEFSEEQLMADPVQILAYDASDPAIWGVPAPDLGTILLSDNRDLENRRWWLVQENGERREMDPPLYSLGICCRWSPDGSHLAYFGITPQGQNLYLVERDGSHQQVLVSGSELGQGAFLIQDFSPDGKHLMFVFAHAGPGFPFGENQLYTMGVDGSGLKALTSPGEGAHNQIRWSPDGQRIAFMDAHHRVWMAELFMP